METKNTQIPFGAKDSEIKGWEYTIPEGMEAEIKDGKIIVRENEDERTRKWIIKFIAEQYPEAWKDKKNKMLAYLERQKEQKPAINIEHLKSYMLQYLQDAANRKDDSEIEADTDKWAKMIINAFGLSQTLENYKISDERATAKMEGILEGRQDVINNPEKYGLQKPVEWSEEDELFLGVCKNALSKYECSDKWNVSIISEWLENHLKSFHPQPHWKPSEEQMRAVFDASERNDKLGFVLRNLYNDLKKL